MAGYPGITELAQLVDALSPVDRALFQRIYAINSSAGEQRLMPGMEPWVVQQFGSVEAVTRQQIVRVTNMVTYEGTIFNALRARRPVAVLSGKNLDDQLVEMSKADPFRNPLTGTPEDPFGRVVGKYCVTASNIAKFEGLHGLVIFNEFHPLRFSREQVIDYFDVAWEWVERAQEMKPEARYFFLIWNCLWRAAASINHGHLQVMLTTDRHYPRIEWLRRAALDYKEDYGANYFADLFHVHNSVGCAVEKRGVKIMAHLTPMRDNEVVLFADEFNLSFKERIYEVMAFLRDRIGVTSFNFSLVTPPLAETPESWEGFPVLARVVDRGNLNERASDIGAMTMYASSSANTNPLALAGQLREYLGERG